MTIVLMMGIVMTIVMHKSDIMNIIQYTKTFFHRQKDDEIVAFLSKNFKRNV